MMTLKAKFVYCYEVHMFKDIKKRYNSEEIRQKFFEYLWEIKRNPTVENKPEHIMDKYSSLQIINWIPSQPTNQQG